MGELKRFYDRRNDVIDLYRRVGRTPVADAILNKDWDLSDDLHIQAAYAALDLLERVILESDLTPEERNEIELNKWANSGASEYVEITGGDNE